MTTHGIAEQNKTLYVPVDGCEQKNSSKQWFTFKGLFWIRIPIE
jgi:hypothetical protein